MSAGSMRVLVIENDTDLRNRIRRYLESEGYEVATAADGREGLQQQRANPARVVVTEIFLPEKEGIETIFDLRREFPQVAIIAMSGGSKLMKSMDYLAVARELGAIKSLKKPFPLVELGDALRELR